ncbi:hypothetical protein BDN67DRAFT_876584, partial [Paxillus ammoniavirescens]
ELQKLNNCVAVLESTAQTSLANQQIVTSGLQAAEERLHKIEDSFNELAKPKVAAEGSSKNVSNQHPKLKAIIHPLFFELCGVERLAKQDERIQTLVDNLEPLPNDLPFSSKIDHAVNARFINEIVDRVWENETALCNNPNGKPELPDAAYNKDVIIKMTKSYWRNLQMQVKARADPAKFLKLQDKQCNTRRRARRSLIANRRRQAVAGFELKYNVQGAAAMIDTDFGSDYLSFNDSSLSEDSRKRRKDQDAPTNGWMKVGLRWHSLDYVIFLIELDSIVKAHPTTQHSSTSTANAAPPAKHRKTTKKGDTSTKSFSVHPSKMSDKPPQSGKAQPTIPFKPMMRKAWLTANPSVEVLEGMAWLQGFHARAKKGELAAKDRAYLGELAEWIAEHDGDDE